MNRWHFGWAAGLLSIAVIVFAAEGASAPTKIKGIDFKYSDQNSRIEITADGAVQFEKIVSKEDHQVVLEFKNAQILKSIARKQDTSSFKGKVALISPYQAGENVRIVIQLKDDVNVDAFTEGNHVVALVDNGKVNTKPKDLAAEDELTNTNIEPKAGANESSEGLDTFFETKETKKYRGKPISLQLNEANIHDVFRVISEASEFNIVLGDDVAGKVTINLVDLPWDQALDIILQSQKLAAERNGNVLRIATQQTFLREKSQEANLSNVIKAPDPIVVKIFPISYAKIDDLAKILSDFLSVQPGAAPAAAPSIASGATGAPQGNQQEEAAAQVSSGKLGSIQIDTRTNSLVIRDTAQSLEKIGRIIKELDTQTPQILIEAKFVEIQENNVRDIQGRIFGSSRELDPGGSFGFKTGQKNNVGVAFGGSKAEFPTSFAITPVPGASFGFAPKAQVIPGIPELGALLSITETLATSKVIASPRIITQNRESAEISQGKTIQLPTTAGANASGSFLTVNANLNLKVTPQVTHEGGINLKIEFSQEVPSASVIGGAALTTDTKKVDTNVLVESGSTLVIGGVYTNIENSSEEGIPILRDIPILGFLFGGKFKSLVKGELFIFLTPRILNEKDTEIKG